MTETGHFLGPIQVTLSTGTEGATIFYRIDPNQYPPAPTHAGGTGTNGTAIYTGPITVSNGAKRYFSVIAYKEGMSDSAVTSYDVDNSNPPNMPNLADDGSSGGQPAYDENGNLKQYKAWAYTYDAQNRLRTAWKGRRGQSVNLDN